MSKFNYQVGNVEVNSDIALSDEELEGYTQMGIQRCGNKLARVIIAQPEGCPDDMIDIKFVERVIKFERIRRITGYLVGSLDRFNDAKRAEERDRVKHTIPKV